MASEVYKIIKLSPQYMTKSTSKVSKYNFRNEHQANLPQVNTTHYVLMSFPYEAIYCAFNIFQKFVFCLALYTEEINLQTFVII